MIIGYVSGETLLELGMIEANTEEAADFIKSVFLKKETFINNRF